MAICSMLHLQAQSSDCVSGSVLNNGDDNWSEQCYLGSDCEEQGNPCQANDVVMLGAFVANSSGGPIAPCQTGEESTLYLWGTFQNNTGTSRYAVRTSTEVWINNSVHSFFNECSFDELSSGETQVVLLGEFTQTCGGSIELVNTWVGWSTSQAQCTDPGGENYSSFCGQYPPAKCSKELGAIQLLVPNFTYTCGTNNNEGNTEIHFTDLSAGGAVPLSYNWDFGDGNYSTLQNPTHIFEGSSGMYFVMLTVTDLQGVSAAVEFQLNLDSIDCCFLTFECPNPVGGIFACLNELPPPNQELIELRDSCGQAIYTIVESTPEGSGCPGDTLFLTRTTYITDGSSTDSCVQVFRFFDDVVPEIRCPGDVTVSCASEVPAPDLAAVVTSDFCGGEVTVTVAADIISNTICDNSYTILRVFTAMDACDNSATCEQIITVVDIIPPSITCVSEVTVSCASAVPAPNTSGIITTDNCGGAVSVTVAADVINDLGCSNSYTITRIYTATDACENTATCAQTIVVDDNTPPTITTCLANVTVSCASSVPAPNVSAIITSDNCGGGATVTVAADVISNLTCANSYTITRIYTATDACANTAICAQTIVVDDNTAPSIICPLNITVSCASLVPAVNIPTVITSDLCGGGVTVTVATDVINNLNCENSYTITRIYTATDACANTSTCAQTIVIDDNTAPSITCPANVTVSCANQVPAANISSVVTSDFCGGGVTVTVAADVISNSTCANSYTITRTYTASDECGNISICAQTIVVDDNTAPSITCPPNVTVSCASEVPAANISAVVTSDLCGGSVTVSVTADVISNSSCANSYTISRVYTATDACDNSTTCVQTITVNDNVPPSIACLSNVTVSCESAVPASNTSAITTSDNCGGAVSVTVAADVISDSTCVNSYNITRVYTASDACGNTASCVQIITVDDQISPTIVTCPANLNVACADDVPDNTGDIVAIDNCAGAVTVSFSEVISNQTCLNDFTLTRTYTVADICGNTATCEQIIEVADTLAPGLITCPPDITLSCSEGIPHPDTAGVTILDNCDGEMSLQVTDVIEGPPCNFTLVRTYFASDDCGNSASCVQVITFIDTIAPLIEFTDPLIQGLSNGDTLNVQCYGQNINWDLPQFDENSVNATDNCNTPLTVGFEQSLLSQGDCNVDGYINIYRLDWSAIDSCQNITEAFLFLKLIDTIPPVLHDVPADITIDGSSLPELPTVYATDECLCACAMLVEESSLQAGCMDGQTITRTWSAMDDCGNISSRTQIITLRDTSGPALLVELVDMRPISNGDHMVFTCTEGGIPSIFESMNQQSISFIDHSGPVRITFDKDVLRPTNCEFFGFMEQHIYTWEALDACGNTSAFSFTVQLRDDAAPQIINAPAMACMNDPVLDLIEAIDNCGQASIQYWDVPVVNPCGEGMAIRRTYEAFDPCGNTTRDTVMLIPDDNTAPLLSFTHPLLTELPANDTITVECQSNGNRMTPFDSASVYAIDGCIENIAVDYSERLISSFDCGRDRRVGLLQLNWTATDGCGNFSTLSLMAYVIDETGPVLIDFKDSLSIGCQEEMPVIKAIDHCGSVASMIYQDSIIPGPCVYEYDIIRQVRATDECGNITEAKQFIHVGDENGPVISGVIDQLCDDLSMPLVTAFDPCADAFVGVTMVQDTLVDVCPAGLVIQRTWTAVDACGHITEIEQIIVMGDTTPPEILIPSYSIIRDYMDSDTIPEVLMSQHDIIDALNAINERSVFVLDDCDQDIIPVFNLQVIVSANVNVDGFTEQRRYKWIATDICGNVDSVSIIVNILDDIPPVMELPDDMTIICSPLPPPDHMLPEDSSEVVSITYTETIQEGSEHGEFIVIRSWIVTDMSGNTSQIVQRIKWIPDTFLECDIILPETVECNSHGVVISSDVTGGIAPYTYWWEIEGDECFIQGGQNTPEINIYVGWHTVKIRLFVTDSFGCATMCETELICESVQPGSNQSFSSNSSNTAYDEDNLKSLSFWPNPAYESVNVRFESKDEAEVHVTLLDFMGRNVLEERYTVIQGQNDLLLDVHKLGIGPYILQVESKDQRYTKRIVIMD